MTTLKYKLIRTGIALSAILFAGCSEDLLDITPEGTPGELNFWQSANDAIAAANAMYAPFDGEEFYGRGYMWYINASDDMVTGRTNAKAQNVKNFSKETAGVSYLADQWRMRYIVIKRANDIILKVPAIDMDEALKNRILGEAHFLAGLMYFELAYTYGDSEAGVPILDRENPTEIYVSRATSVDVNYAYIAQELTAAADLLPYFEDLEPADYGRAHKTAAWAYLAKMYLYAGDYENAEKYADMVIGTNKHGLVPVYKDVFAIANNWSKEYIWSANSSVLGGSILPGVMLENKGWGKYNGWGYFQPTKELYDAFEAGDERREATVLKFGDEFMYFGELMSYSSTNSLTGYQFNKYMEPFRYADGAELNPNGDHPTTSLNPPLLRYAELLLIKAEAALMQGKNADTEINLVRDRAGLDPLTDATLDDLKQERRCELAGELSNRHFDLVRWGDAQATYSQPLHGADGQEVWPARTFNPAVHHVWAVPQGEIDNSGGLIKQNEGW